MQRKIILGDKNLKDMDGYWGLKTTWMNKKDRTPVDAHHRLQELYKKREALAEVSSQWFNKTPKDAFLGHTIREGMKQRVLYCMHNDSDLKSYSTEYPDQGYDRHKRHLLRALRDKELPVYINHPDYQDPRSQVTLQSRLKGEYLEIPYHQDLVDEREKLDHQSKRLWSVIRAYESILEDYVGDKKNKSSYSNAEILIYTIEGHDYYFKNYSNDKTMLPASSIERIE